MSMNHKILVIEDEESIRKIIKDYFRREGYEILEACNGREGLEVFKSIDVDLVILDVMMPEMDGWTVCRKIREVSSTPIVMLTARGKDEDELMGLELKADDYVKKPFNPSILVARVNNLLERSKGEPIEGKDDSKVMLGGIEVDRYARNVTVEGEEIVLTPKEFEILDYFMQNEGKVMTRENLLSRVWGYDYFGDARVVDTHIKKLRKALGDKSYLIRTVFGVGYKFEVPDDKA